MKNIQDYRLLDSGGGRKLEQAGAFRIIRPALNAFWSPSLPAHEWERADAVFTRESSGGGVWDWKIAAPGRDSSWAVRWGGVNLLVKPTNFGHLGFFAEQAGNWAWLRERIGEMGGSVPALNLFAYSGGATLAMAQAGADVCHLDASKGIIEWAGRNQELNPETKGKIRWICDDAMKFVAREQRRGRKYRGIVLDPPSFGRGTQGQVWKIETGIRSLLDSCRQILDLSGSCFVLLSCHSQGFSPVSLGRILQEVFVHDGGHVESGEMTIPEQTGKQLPAGLYARFSK